MSETKRLMSDASQNAVSNIISRITHDYTLVKKKYKQKDKMTASACWHVAATERGNPLMVECFTDLCF